MATLEVHNNRGGVEYVDVPQHSPALIGSDPKCEIVLDGPDILPIHARLRWKQGRPKIETMPNAAPLVINGKRLLASKLSQGDEIRVGNCRIFLMKLDGQAAVDTEKTRVQTAPTGASSRPAKAKPPATPKVSKSLEWMKDLKDIEVAPPSFEVAPDGATTERSVASEEIFDLPAVGDRPRSEMAPKANRPKKKTRRRWLSLISGADRSPGDERVFSSPVVLGLAGTIAVLVLLSFVLLRMISHRTADAQYQLATESYEDSDYPNAIRRFEAFLERHPKDPRTSRARVMKGLSGIRQYMIGGAPAWTEALNAVDNTLGSISSEPAYGDLQMDLAADVVKIAQGLADRARLGADAQALAEAERTVTLHDQIAGKGAADLRSRTRLPATLTSARAAVRKAQIRLAALTEMDNAFKRSSAAQIYATRDRLVAEYSDLASDQAVVDQLTRANDLLRQAVILDSSTRPAILGPRLEALGPPTTLVIRTVRKPMPRSESVVYARAEGLVYGLSEADGSPLWQRPAGHATPFAPISITGDATSALYFDARSEELVKIKARTGEVIWRQVIGEPIGSPPLVLGNDLYQTTPSGKLLQINLGSGELRGTLEMGRPLTATPAADELGQHLYVMADRANLFIVARDPFACVGVEYLGHESGSIACAPSRIGRYLVVSINDGIDSSRWRVYVLDASGETMRFRQSIAIPGWQWGPPVVQGSVIWAVSDRGGLAAYAIGAENEAEPLHLVAENTVENVSIGPVYALARSERDLWVSSRGSSGLRLSLERGAVEAAWTLSEVGSSRGPIQFAGQRITLTHQATEGRGVTLWNLDPADGSVTWISTLGAGWAVPPRPFPDGERVRTFSAEGRELTIALSNLEKGGFVESPAVRSGTQRIPQNPVATVTSEGTTVIFPAWPASRMLVCGSDSQVKSVDLPTALTASPRFLGSDLVIVTREGLVYLVDPRTGAMKAEPYVPPFDRANPVRWRSPAILEDGMIVLVDASGILRRLRVQPDPRPHLVAEGESVNLKSPVIADPVTIGSVLVAATADGFVRAFSGRDLSPLGAWPLDNPLAFGPVTLDTLVLAADTAGNVLTIDREGRKKWSVLVAGGPPIGVPVLQGDSLWWLGRDGVLTRLAAADGAFLDRIPLEALPAGGPIVCKGEILVPTAPGTLRRFVPEEKASSTEAGKAQEPPQDGHDAEGGR